MQEAVQMTARLDGTPESVILCVAFLSLAVNAGLIPSLISGPDKIPRTGRKHLNMRED